MKMPTIPWLPCVSVDRKIRAVIKERMERGATDELDRKLAVLIERQKRIERVGWFS